MGFGHRRAESRYNVRMVEKNYKLGSLVRVPQHTSVRRAVEPEPEILWTLRDPRSTRPDSDSKRTRHE